MDRHEIKYLVFDVESVPDPKLIRLAKYPDEAIGEDEAVMRYRQEILDSSGGATEFIPVTFQYPVAVAVAKVLDDFTLDDIVCLDDPAFRTCEMVRLFWIGVEHTYAGASLVTFNGRGFDIPLLELMAYRYGIGAQRHFKDRYAGRNRFGSKHIDLQDWISNYGSIRVHGGLNMLAKIIGKPGKMGTRGDQVYGLFLKGEIRKINDYCIHDVLDTYFIFLRTRVMTGDLTIDREQEIVRMTKRFITENRQRIPAFEEYLANWGDWVPWPA